MGLLRSEIFRGNMLNQIGGTMKKVFVVMFLLVFAVLSVFAMPKDEAMNQIRAKAGIKQNEPIPAFNSDFSLNTKSVATKGILFLDGDFRGWAPTPLNSMNCSKSGDTIQVVAGRAGGGDATGFLGVYYTISTDAGVTWSTPTLITATGPYTRNYCELAVDEGLYPYVLVNYRTANYCGDWFTTDAAGPGAGGWTTPVLVTDTINAFGYMPSIAASPTGEKIGIMAYDPTGGAGTNYSADYGVSWGTYGFDANLNGEEMWGIDVSAARWGAGDDIHAIVGMVWADEPRSDIAGTGANTAFFHSYSKSADGGATWSTPIPLFSTSIRPAVRGMDGLTLTYYIDTILVDSFFVDTLGDTTYFMNTSCDSTLVTAHYDAATGCWADNYGLVDASAYGFGTWWYWWDAEYYSEKSTFYYAIPMADLFVDYYENAGENLGTFVWQGQSIMFGYKADTETGFTYKYIDIHDAVVDADGASATWRGNAYSANLAYDATNDIMYIVYNDYVDTATEMGSVEALKIDLSGANDTIYRTTLLLNADPYSVECANYVGSDGNLSIAYCTSADSLDSIYFSSVNMDSVTGWEAVPSREFLNGVEALSDVKVIGNAFNVPSILKGEGSLSFSIASNSDVNVSMYDVTGRMVKSLANGSFTKGIHTINMNSEDFNQGVYFVKVNANGMSVSKKVIVVK